MLNNDLSGYAREDLAEHTANSFEHEPVLANEVLKRLDTFINDPIYFSDCLEEASPVGTGHQAVISMLIAENDVLREWFREQNVIISAARRYRQAEIMHRKNPSLNTAREQVLAQIELDKALATFE
jgi:hypothetical protein